MPCGRFQSEASSRATLSRSSKLREVGFICLKLIICNNNIRYYASGRAGGFGWPGCAGPSASSICEIWTWSASSMGFSIGVAASCAILSEDTIAICLPSRAGSLLRLAVHPDR
jgi:hypothetical protein